MKKILSYLTSRLKPEEKVYPYECIPKYLRQKIEKIFFSSFLLFFFFLIISFRIDTSFFLFALIIFLSGFYMTTSLYYASTRDHIKEVAGVIIYTERFGYRKQKKSLHIQDDSGNVYAVYVTELKNKLLFRKGNDVVFYVKDSLLRYEDGLYLSGYPILIKRVDAKIS